MPHIRRLLVVAVLLGPLGVLSPECEASPVTGTLNFSGDAQVGSTFTNFLCTFVNNQPCPVNRGNFQASASQTGDFTALASAFGYIRNLEFHCCQPINEPFGYPEFVSFGAGSDVTIDLFFIEAGTFGAGDCSQPAAVGQTCTPIVPTLVSPANPMGLSPFNITNTASGSTLTFDVFGDSRRISTGETAPITGTFTMNFGSPFQTYMTTLLAGGGVNGSYSATFEAGTVAVPEPPSLLLLATCALGLLGAIHRKLCL